MKINNIPSDVLLEIISYCEIKDISCLKTTCKDLNNEIVYVEDYIFYNELLYINKHVENPNIIEDTSMTIHTTNTTNIKNHFYNFLESFCKQVYTHVRKEYLQYIYNNENLSNDNINLQLEIVEKIKYLSPISFYKNDYLLKDLVIYYINNKTLVSYNNKISLLASFYFIKMLMPNISHSKSIILNFIESLFAHTKIYKKNKYINSVYTYGLNLLNLQDNLITFNDNITLSKYITCSCALKKLMGFKLLDLKQTHFVKCNKCDIKSNVDKVINYKKIFFTNELISYNYNEIKKFLKRENKSLFDYINKTESEIVKNYIFIKSPITNEKFCILSYKYTILLTKLNSKYINRIKKFLSKEEKKLLINYFN